MSNFNLFPGFVKYRSAPTAARREKFYFPAARAPLTSFFPFFAEALAEAVKENFILFFLLALLSQGSA